ncbi:tail fiber protein [Myxococcota bacterium]|nr:tail fiber protein [Myxococcota bacterium]
MLMRFFRYAQRRSTVLFVALLAASFSFGANCTPGTTVCAENCPKGDKGDKGDQGSAGKDGRDGLQGPAGATGPQGPAGAAGPKGDKGDKGEAGTCNATNCQQGPAGPAGPVGPQGIAGPACTIGQTSTDNNGNTVITFNCGTTNTNAVFRTTPAGTIIAFAGEKSKIPAGWFLCDGREISRTQYQDLFLAIGVANGAGDTVTTFNIPDLRGRFLRGVDDAQGRDPDASKRTAPANFSGTPTGNAGDKVGSVQSDALKIHSHKANTGDGLLVYTIGGSGDRYGGGNEKMVRVPLTSEGDSTESRPKNVGVNWLIKY